jgi:hypothetical protein
MNAALKEETITLLDDEPAQQYQAPALRQESAMAMTSPQNMLRLAVERGADLDQLERFMALSVQHEKREAEKAYNVAFAAFKAEGVKILKNRNVTAGPLSGKKYAELFAVVNAITPALSKQGLSSSWRLSIDKPDWIEVTCTIKHIDGHSESVSMGGPPDAGGAKNAIQARASTVSYLERYTLKAIAGVSEQEDDDDGNGRPDLIPVVLLQAGQSAAAAGWNYLVAWWRHLTPAEQAQMASQIDQLKRDAKAADKAKGEAA